MARAARLSECAVRTGEEKRGKKDEGEKRRDGEGLICTRGEHKE